MAGWVDVNAAQIGDLLSGRRSPFFAQARRLGERIEQNARQRCNVGVTGQTRASIHTQVNIGADEIVVRVGSPLPKARFLELGTRARIETGAPPPPLAAISPWARSKGISPVWLRRKIVQRGTRPHPFLRPALDEVTRGLR